MEPNRETATVAQGKLAAAPRSRSKAQIDCPLHGTQPTVITDSIGMYCYQCVREGRLQPLVETR